MKLILSLIFKLFIFSFSTFGVYLTVRDAAYPTEALSYFTTIINIFTAVFYALFITELVLRKSSHPLLRFFKQSLMVYLIITMLVYSFVLIPYIIEEQINYSIFSGKDLLIHYVVPISVLFDYGFFEAKGKIKSYYAYANILNSVLYVMYVWIYVSFGGRFHSGNDLLNYPYFFLNIEQNGLIPVILACLCILFVVVFVGWVIYMIDQLTSVPLKLSQVKRK